MPRNGSGSYSLPAGNPVSSGTTIEASWANTTLPDIATALTNSIAKDGQTPASSNLPMGGNIHTGVGAASARNHYAQAAQVQDGAYNLVGSVAGTDTITGSLSPSLTAYASGMGVVLIPANTNTGAATLALNGLTARAIRTLDDDALVGGELVADEEAYLIYHSAANQWRLLNPRTPNGSFTGTLTGVSGTVTGPIKWRRDGRNVTLISDSDLTGTSNATTMTITGMPAIARPSDVREIFVLVTDDSVAVGGRVQITSGGLMTFLKSIAATSAVTYASNNFTGSGTKGIKGGWNVTYPIAVP